jgi:MFS family permease
MTLSQDESSSPRRKRWLSLSVASLATLLVTADTGQLSIALPVIITEFNADLTLASWIALVYALITASLYLPCGRLSDLVGIGKVFSAGFLLYSASALAAGWSQNAEQLILFRAFQAAGSALIMANNFALVTALFPPEERGRAMGISGGTVSALGYTLGPVLGGLLTYAFVWRSNSKEPFDFPGTITFALSISLLLLGLATAQKAPGQALSSPLNFLAELSSWFCLFGWNTVRAFHFWI